MPNTKENKRAGAIQRQEARASRTPQEQLKRLDAMFGEGKGARRERARLMASLLTPKKEPLAPDTMKPCDMDTKSTVDLVAKVERFTKAHVDGKTVMFAGLGAGVRGQAIFAYAPNPKKVAVPEEFDGMEVMVVKGARPKPAGD